MTAPLMPKATAVWLVENTTLTFRQIATYCELHELEIQAIADGDIAYNIIGISPVSNGQLTLEEIRRCEADETTDLISNKPEYDVKEINARNRKVLSPSQRADKPAAILWVVHHCPEMTDAQICKLIGTTKPTIASIRLGTRKDMDTLREKSPVGIGLCTEKDLEQILMSNKAKAEKAEKAKNESDKKTVRKKTTKKVAPKKDKAKKAVKATTAKKAEPKKAVKVKATAKKTTAKKVTVKKTTAKKAKK